MSTSTINGEFNDDDEDDIIEDIDRETLIRQRIAKDMLDREIAGRAHWEMELKKKKEESEKAKAEAAAAAMSGVAAAPAAIAKVPIPEDILQILRKRGLRPPEKKTRARAAKSVKGASRVLRGNPSLRSSSRATVPPPPPQTDKTKKSLVVKLPVSLPITKPRSLIVRLPVNLHIALPIIHNRPRPDYKKCNKKCNKTLPNGKKTRWLEIGDFDRDENGELNKQCRGCVKIDRDRRARKKAAAEEARARGETSWGNSGRVLRSRG